MPIFYYHSSQQRIATVGMVIIVGLILGSEENGPVLSGSSAASENREHRSNGRDPAGAGLLDCTRRWRA